MGDKRKLTGLKVILGVVGGFFAANMAGTAYLSSSAGKKMKANSNGNNMMYSVTLGTKKIDVKADTDHAYVNCMTGVAEIDVTDIPNHYDMYIELGSIFAVYVIKLPEGLRVSIEGTGHHSVLNNQYGEDIDKSLPAVHIMVENARCSVINVVRSKSEKEYTELN